MLFVVVVHASERVFKDIACHFSALRYSLRLVESPVNAKVDSALSVFFLSLGEPVESAGHEGPDLTIIAYRHAVEFI